MALVCLCGGIGWQGFGSVLVRVWVFVVDGGFCWSETKADWAALEAGFCGFVVAKDNEAGAGVREHIVFEALVVFDFAEL